MADRIEIDISELYSKKLSEYAAMLNDPQVMIRINGTIAKAIEPYVPMKTGALRRSVRVFPDYVSWGSGLWQRRSRAPYQYMGLVKGPNIPIFKKGSRRKGMTPKIIGWYSPRGGTKHYTGDILGGKTGMWHGWQFGYTTPGTQSQWLTAYKGQLRSRTNKQLAWLLKKECKKRGLNT